jgi:hypothetical protein
MNPNWAIAAGLIVISGAIFIALRVSRAHQVIAAILHTDRLLDAIDQHRKEEQS